MWSISTQRLLRAQDDVDTQTHRARLEERLLELEAEARAIKYYQNTLAPINCLPPEILSTVFLIVAERTQLQLKLGYRPGPYVDMAWLPCTTQVCRRWREIALSCPALWSHISFATPELTELMLLRSKNTPISVMFEVAGENGYPRHILDALSQSHRLKSIELQGSPTDWGFGFTRTPRMNIAAILLHCSVSMPILESLRLRDQHWRGFKFPGGSFPDGAPALKYLEALGCEISSWRDLPLGTNLTTLHLETHPGAPRPTIEELHSCLDRVPSLLSLHLTSFLPIDFEDNPRLSERLDLTPVLPQLKEMRLVDYVRPILTFLRAFYIPPSTSLEIVCDREADDDFLGRIEDLIRLLSSAWDRVVQSGCRSMAVRQDNFLRRPRMGYDMCFNYHHDEGRVQNGQDLRIKLLGVADHSEDLDFYIDTIDTVLSCFKQWFDLSPVRSFTGDGVILWDTTCNILRDLPHLEEIHLKSTPIGGLIKALADQPSSDSDSGVAQEARSFAAFSSLYLKDVDFRIRNPVTMNRFNILYVGDIFRDGAFIATPLVESLRHCPVKKVSIERCYNFERKHWAMMQEQLPGVDVIWDGRENLRASAEPEEVIVEDLEEETWSDEEQNIWEDEDYGVMGEIGEAGEPEEMDGEEETGWGEAHDDLEAEGSGVSESG
ncbi:hypothetical protein DFP72DRAFT_1177014 [Ephemerocybe angulata]|uniref:F-box domain-containing protein n=1 Tax=Ephemerocybe angulata TaxID=980116 RepID=A0A8H6LXN3_9AGAR|nr:hypothetical protein DFP72DRAFT_1177014 [Tulosesus angulatus]